MKPGFFIDRPIQATRVRATTLHIDYAPCSEDQRHVSGSERLDGVSSGRYPDRAGAERYAGYDLYAK